MLRVIYNILWHLTASKKSFTTRLFASFPKAGQIFEKKMLCKWISRPNWLNLLSWFILFDHNCEFLSTSICVDGRKLIRCQVHFMKLVSSWCWEEGFDKPFLGCRHFLKPEVREQFWFFYPWGKNTQPWREKLPSICRRVLGVAGFRA